MRNDKLDIMEEESDDETHEEKKDDDYHEKGTDDEIRNQWIGQGRLSNFVSRLMLISATTSTTLISTLQTLMYVLMLPMLNLKFSKMALVADAKSAVKKCWRFASNKLHLNDN